MDDLSIDQKKLPGVKEVCRDFAVLEDHCLAHNLQEQEIESHLASNVHKSRLVQQDLRVAKRLQEEEDQRAKAQSRRQHQHIERIDNEMAQEMQDRLVWQAEQQRQQEERDEAIARKLQEREMKEERKRQKQMEASLEEPYYEDKAVTRPPSDPRVQDPDIDSPVYSSREWHHDLSQGRSPDDRSPKLDQKKRRDGQGNLYRHPAETVRSRAPESYNTDDARGRHDGKGRRPEHYPSEGRTKYPEEYLSERNRHVEAEYTEHRRHKKSQPRDQLEEPHDQDPMALTKERAHRDDVERDKMFDKERDRARRRDRDRDGEKERDGRRTRDEFQYRDEDRSHTRLLDEDGSRDRNDHRHGGRERDRRGQKDAGREGAGDRDQHRSKDRGRGREPFDPAGRGWLEDGPEHAECSGRQKVVSDFDDVFAEPRARAHSGEARSPGHSPRERGRIDRGEYVLKEATQGLAQMDIRQQELKDMEVARKLQEEELKASQLDKRAAQVAQDEEIARRLMEEEKREYKRSRDKEKQAMERQQRRAEGDYVKPTHEEVVRPRTREESDYQMARNPKPARPPPRTHNYENVDPSYSYSENYSPRPPSRPEAAYKGAYYRQ